ncbi:hypothetical protein ACFL3A_03775 [Pseudomonadota bacterium]
MRRHLYPLVVALLLLSLPVVATDQDPHRVIAKGNAGSLTVDAFDAYYEALVFCLGEIGQPTHFSDAQKQQMQQVMVTGFLALPAETQQALANARTTWTQYRTAWPILNIDQKKAFAFDVLSLAYGDAAASQALGLNTVSSGDGTGSGTSVNVPWSEGYSKSYGGGIDAGDGTYEVETYDSNTGSYGYSYE